jgi:hypothetical protein
VTDDQILAAFSGDYATARDRFRQAATAAGWALTSYETGDVGPSGDALTIDVAALAAPAHPGATFILSSGLHGVEGHFGSAVQVAALRAISADPASLGEMHLVFVHALNPWGFAWSRRCDARNVDVNRAFRWPGMPVPPSDEAYGVIDGLLNPSRSPSADWFPLRLMTAALRSGPATLKRTIASGQRSHSKGLFYAGVDAPPLQAFLERELPRWVGGASTVMHLDLHTGLGRSGDATLIVDYPMTDDERAWWTTSVGQHVLSEALRDPKAYTATGSLGQWCVARGLASRYLFAFAEFGTFSGPRILAGLRAENQAHHWAAAGDPATAAAKARLRELFCPSDPVWRVQAVQRALRIVEAVVHRGAPRP